MSTSISTDWSFRGIETVILENELLRVVVMPELGGKIWELTYKPLDVQPLWHHPRLKPRPLPYSTVYDDTFVGGWDEIFPNLIAEEMGNQTLPDHGEVWALPWEFRVEQHSTEEISAHLSVETVVRAFRLDKWLTLRSGENMLRCRYVATSLSGEAQPVLWAAHIPLTLPGRSHIEIGAQQMYLDAFGRPRSGRGDVTYDWPYLVDARGVRHDMREVLPASSAVTELQWATHLGAGTCSLVSAEAGVAVRLTFDPAVVSSCFVFTSYGGWRDLHVVVLEPATGYPPSLMEGQLKGTHRMLEPDQSLQWDFAVQVDEWDVSTVPLP